MIIKLTIIMISKYQKVGRLRLEDALKQLRENPEAAMEGWSEARKKAWKAIDKNPNSYYYRFNAPGEEQRTGPWTQAEQKLFHQRLKEMGANGQWGVFSMVIPGRVGYQCSNYYRQLIETNKIKDPNYVLDEKGKAHYLFSTKDGRKTFRTHCKHKRDGSSYLRKSSQTNASESDHDENATNNNNNNNNNTDNTTETTKTTTRTVRRTKRRRRTRRYSSDVDYSDDSDGDWTYGRERDEDDSGDYRLSSSATTNTVKRPRTTRRRAAEEAAAEESSATSPPVTTGGGGGRVANSDVNPLPGYIDPITLEEVVKPAISPYGHVMG
jgi:hypothetical protein